MIKSPIMIPDPVVEIMFAMSMHKRATRFLDESICSNITEDVT